VYLKKLRDTMKNMSELEDGWEEVTEEIEGTGSGEYVTKDELRSMLAEFLGGNSDSDSDDDDGWELLDDLGDDLKENFSLADVERIAEEKVQAAIKALTSKKATNTKAAPVKKAAPKKEPESLPTSPTKKKFGAKLWGTE